LRELGYHQQESYWWKSSLVHNYLNRAGFYLPEKTTDPFGGVETFEFDSLQLTMRSLTDAVGNRRRWRTDYCSLKPAKMTDPNDNVTEMLYDPLGFLLVRSQHGTSMDDLQEEVTTGDKSLEQYHVL